MAGVCFWFKMADRNYTFREESYDGKKSEREIFSGKTNDGCRTHPDS